MGKYRNRETGEIKSQGEWRAEFSHVSLPRTWKQATLDGLGLDAVLDGVKPELGDYQVAVLDGAVQNDDGIWIENWEIEWMFSDYTDEDGNVVTRAQQEQNYQAQKDADLAAGQRSRRNGLLLETDWWAVADRTMSDSETTYRQALRDITDHANFPNLLEEDWPTKP